MNAADQCEKLKERALSLMSLLLEKHWQEIYCNAKENGETAATVKLVLSPDANKFDVVIEYQRTVKQTKSAPIDDGERYLPGT